MNIPIKLKNAFCFCLPLLFSYGFNMIFGIFDVFQSDLRSNEPQFGLDNSYFHIIFLNIKQIGVNFAGIIVSTYFAIKLYIRWNFIKN